MAKILTTSLSFSPPACPNDDHGCIAAHIALRHDAAYRETLLARLIAHAVEVEADVLLTPAGYFASGGPADLPNVVATVQGLLGAAGANGLCVAFGVDGNTGGEERFSPDQFMLAVTRTSVLGGARKASPAPGEEAYIPVGDPWALLTVGHDQVGRVFDHAGTRFSLAVCYDGLGPNHHGWAKPHGLNAVLNGIHWFFPYAPGKGDFYFARGLASASWTWQVPVLFSASFICRLVPRRFPGGVMGFPWPEGKTTNRWKYGDNNLAPVGDDDLNRYIRTRTFET